MIEKYLPLLNYKINPAEHILPRLIKFEKGGVKLWFFACNHSRDTNNLMFRALKKAFEELAPNLVIIESHNSVNQLNNNPELQAKMLQKTIEQTILEKGESGFTTYLALSQNIPIFCPEPDDEVCLELMLTKFDSEVCLVSYGIMMISYFHRKWLPIKPSKTEYSDEYFKDMQSYIEQDFQKLQFGPNSKLAGFFNWSNFELYFRKITKQELTQTNYDFWCQYDDPIEWQNQTAKGKKEIHILNQASQEHTKIRDACILANLEEKTRQYQKILMVYGGSHYYHQEQALIKMFA